MPEFKMYAGMALMTLLLILALATDDVIISHLFASLSILSGANIYRQVSNNNNTTVKNEN